KHARARSARGANGPVLASSTTTVEGRKKRPALAGRRIIRSTSVVVQVHRDPNRRDHAGRSSDRLFRLEIDGAGCRVLPVRRTDTAAESLVGVAAEVQAAGRVVVLVEDVRRAQDQVGP